MIPKAHFGNTKDEAIDWRQQLAGEDDSADDDEELDETPPEVVGMRSLEPLALASSLSAFFMIALTTCRPRSARRAVVSIVTLAAAGRARLNRGGMHS